MIGGEGRTANTFPLYVSLVALSSVFAITPIALSTGFSFPGEERAAVLLLVGGAALALYLSSSAYRSHLEGLLTAFIVLTSFCFQAGSHLSLGSLSFFTALSVVYASLSILSRVRDQLEVKELLSLRISLGIGLLGCLLLAPPLYLLPTAFVVLITLSGSRGEFDPKLLANRLFVLAPLVSALLLLSFKGGLLPLVELPSQSAPPGYYLVFLLVGFWPWSLLLPIAIDWLWSTRRKGETFLPLVWLAAHLFILEIIPEKSPSASLVLLPPLAAALSSVIANGFTPSAERGWSLLRYFIALLWVALTSLAAASLFVFAAAAENGAPLFFLAAALLLAGHLVWRQRTGIARSYHLPLILLAFCSIAVPFSLQLLASPLRGLLLHLERGSF